MGNKVTQYPINLIITNTFVRYPKRETNEIQLKIKRNKAQTQNVQLKKSEPKKFLN